MSKNPYTSTPEQLAVAIGYKNKFLIADAVMPRVPVRKKNFEYNVFDKRDGFTVPDTQVGRKSELNMASFGSEKVPGVAKDYGLRDIIPVDDAADTAGDNLPNAVNRTTAKLTSLIHLDREVRVANKVFDNSNYDHKVSLAVAERFGAENVNPIGTMLEYLETPLVRPNTAVFGQAAWTKFRTNPSIVKAAHGNDGDAGAATRQAVMDLFELQNLLVGDAFVNIAKPGRAAQINRTWGNNIALLHIAEMFDGEDEILTWGFTPQFGGWVTGEREVAGIGLRGGTEVKVGETVGEVVSAKGAGFFIENAG